MTAFVLAFRCEMAARRFLTALARWLSLRQHSAPAVPPRPAEVSPAAATVVETAWRIPPYVTGERVGRPR